MYIDRLLSDILKNNKKSVLILGPRQTGKSTLIKTLAPELEINLADEETFVRFLSDPGLMKSILGNAKSVFIDEVQRLPSLLNTIQSIIDSAHSPRFILTGSSARKLKRGKANLLPGRILSYELGPLSFTELGSRFDLRKALSRGLLPGIYLEEENVWQKLLRTYSITYLKEEIQAEALTRNLEGFSRFFEVIASHNCNFIDFTKFASLSQIERTTAKRYFDVMVDTLILCPIEAFSTSQKRRLIQHPKYYFFDVGVFNGIMGNFEASSDRKGPLFENLFLQILLSELKGRDIEARISTYRTERGAEVDFILEMKSQVIAIEVKSSKNIGAHDLTGLKSFHDFFGEKHRSIVVYMGDNILEKDGIKILPLHEVIKFLFSTN
ncbi:MAG TPA: ATP-binding protein [Bdellovibrionota bacterium]|nr:ATP-binding protein [Bdellovibrionota bacterium]